jgi:formamidopyrimidine-DNA glycosylase
VPELPEVEVWRRLIVDWLREDAITNVVFLDPALLDEEKRRSAEIHLAGRDVRGISRLGKLLFWDCPNAPTLGVHLRMTGGWARTAPGVPRPRFTRASWGLASGSSVHFIDSRRLGRWYWGKPDAVREAMGVQKLGPDALHSLPDEGILQERMQRRHTLKSALMDQSVVAGIGNIAATEICFRARLSPWTRPDQMTLEQWGSIRTQIQCHLEESIARDAGHTIVYVNAGGINPFALYAREAQPCPACSHPIERRVQSGRSTYFCARCQPLD